MVAITSSVTLLIILHLSVIPERYQRLVHKRADESLKKPITTASIPRDRAFVKLRLY